MQEKIKKVAHEAALLIQKKLPELNFDFSYLLDYIGEAIDNSQVKEKSVIESNLHELFKSITDSYKIVNKL